MESNIKPSSDFTYDKNTRTFSAFASDFGPTDAPGRPGKVFIRSTRTHNVLCFSPAGVEKDREGDITVFLYLNTETGLRVRLFND